MKMKKKQLGLLGLVVTLLSVGILSSAAFAQTNANNSLRKPYMENRPGMENRAFFKNVERKVEKIENGIKITMTSTDADVVAKLQSMEHPGPKVENSKITVTKTNISNGVEIVMTSSDAETVKKLQEGTREHQFGKGMGLMGKNMERKVEKIENGIKMTLTSTDADVVAKLQSMEHPGTKVENSQITVTKTNISNGVEIVMTSSDAETVKKLQEGPGFHGMNNKNFEKKAHGKFRSFLKNAK